METVTTYSILIPVYNAAHSLVELADRIHLSLKGHTYQLVLVDDGSKDGSWEIIESIKKENKYHITAVRLARNAGQHNAILCGLNFCKGDYIVFMDDDLQHPPEEITKLIHKQVESGADIVLGIYDKKQHGTFRNLGSTFLQKSAKYDADAYGEGSSFKLVTRELILKIRDRHQYNFFFLDAVIQWYSANIATVEVTHQPRKYGTSSYPLSSLIRMYFNIHFNYSGLSLKVMTYFGLISSVISFLIGIRFVIRKFVYDVPMGYTSLIVSILFTYSVVMFSLGIIGLYIFNLYNQNQNKPPYTIKKVV
ncbi:MAG: glycosyltransferase [Cytophagaceae bacterium]|jgi:undecaprenyl-phosphate 4-deoxy-4-formamido-L-arabinose transferase|nr:glycosyltransferase [Cytophagaceae bacterium]